MSYYRNLLQELVRDLISADASGSFQRNNFMTHPAITGRFDFRLTNIDGRFRFVVLREPLALFVDITECAHYGTNAVK